MYYSCIDDIEKYIRKLIVKKHFESGDISEGHRVEVTRELLYNFNNLIGIRNKPHGINFDDLFRSVKYSHNIQKLYFKKIDLMANKHLKPVGIYDQFSASMPALNLIDDFNFSLKNLILEGIINSNEFGECNLTNKGKRIFSESLQFTLPFNYSNKNP